MYMDRRKLSLLRSAGYFIARFSIRHPYQASLSTCANSELVDATFPLAQLSAGASPICQDFHPMCAHKGVCARVRVVQMIPVSFVPLARPPCMVPGLTSPRA